MGKLKIKAFEAGPVSSGFSISQGESRGKCFFRIGITKAAQEEFFGAALDPAKDALALMLTDDPKYHHLMGIKVVPVTHEEALPLRRGIKDSVSVKVSVWRSANGKHPASALAMVNSQVNGGGVSVKLPEWARPSPDRTRPGSSS